MDSPNLEKARDYVVDRLQHELPPQLTYHGLRHTLQEVVPAADLLATLENVGEQDHLCVLTAAYFHDLGFIRQREGHELVSIQFAEQVLPEFGYSLEQVTTIRGIIQATCLPQSPTNLLEMIMADSDLDYLGHDNFWERSDDFRQELENYGTKFTDEEWYVYQLQFMQSHQYFTESARRLRNRAKHKHMAEITARLEQVSKPC
jgi:predicted metal-dependent HD superfamily phosphohydrolase